MKTVARKKTVGTSTVSEVTDLHFFTNIIYNDCVFYVINIIIITNSSSSSSSISISISIISIIIILIILVTSLIVLRYMKLHVYKPYKFIIGSSIKTRSK